MKANGETVESYTIITVEPNTVAAKIHNRIPNIIGPQDFGVCGLDQDNRSVTGTARQAGETAKETGKPSFI